MINIHEHRDNNSIPEAELYMMLLESNTSTGKKFRSIVSGEILPMIRRYGVYMVDAIIDETASGTKTAEDFLQAVASDESDRRYAQEHGEDFREEPSLIRGNISDFISEIAEPKDRLNILLEEQEKARLLG